MPDEALFLGLDLGTSGARAVVIDADRQVKATAKSALADHGTNPRDANQWWAAAESEAYYESLKARYKVRIEAPKPAPATTASR